MGNTPKPLPNGEQIIFRPYITLKDGTKIWAKAYGKKAFAIRVNIDDDKNTNS